MGITSIDFEGGESGGNEGLNSQSVGVTGSQSVSPYNKKEDWVLKVDNVGSGTGGMLISKTDATGTEWVTMGFIIQWNDFHTETSDSFFKAHQSSPHFKLDWIRNGDVASVRLINANGSTVVTTGDILQENQWHKFELKWKKGNSNDIKVWMNDKEIIDETGVDLENAGTSDVELVIENQTNQASILNTFVNSFYFVKDDGANMDTNDTRLRNWTVLGTYISTNAGTTSDYGTNLSSGNWGNPQAVPTNDSNIARYSVTKTGGAKSGGVTTDKTTTGGLRLNADIIDTSHHFGYKWIWRYRTNADHRFFGNAGHFFGKYGQQASGSETTDNTVSTATQSATADVWKNLYVVEGYPSSTNGPPDDHWWQIGFGSTAPDITSDVDCGGMWVMVLQKELRRVLVNGVVNNLI